MTMFGLFAENFYRSKPVNSRRVVLHLQFSVLGTKLDKKEKKSRIAASNCPLSTQVTALRRETGDLIKFVSQSGLTRPSWRPRIRSQPMFVLEGPMLIGTSREKENKRDGRQHPHTRMPAVPLGLNTHDPVWWQASTD